jgi:transcription elongation factor Elf1
MEISEIKQRLSNTFNCFGCGANGDVIKFIERYDKRGQYVPAVSGRYTQELQL